MAPKDILERASEEVFEDEEGYSFRLELQPGLSEAELSAVERSGLPIPSEVRELLGFCRGFVLGPHEVAFDAAPGSEYDFVSPAGVPILPDGCGNFWVVDVDPLSAQWGAVLYVCHDPPVVVFQAATLAVFLEQLVEEARLGPRSGGRIEDVHEEASFRVWSENPGLLSLEQARSSGDSGLRSFADELPDRFDLCDLRRASIGDGFSWGRAGPSAEVRRFGTARLFAVERRTFPGKKLPGLLSRLFGKRG